MLEIYELLDRFEILYPANTKISDLRRAYIDKDLSSIFRLVTDDNKENLRKLIMQDNIWKLWPLLDDITDTQFVNAFKTFIVKELNIDHDCFSRGQLQSKIWLIHELKKLKLDLGTVFLCAGWYATLSTMIFESGMTVDKIRSFDIDESCVEIAEIFNKQWVIDEWKFKSTTQNILDIDYFWHSFVVQRSNGTECILTETPTTIINTSCEHIKEFDKWYSLIPKGRLVILQSNNYFEVKEHVNCVSSAEELSMQAPMSNCLFLGNLPLEKYSRFMKIGIK
jgi:hypothetical protein